jgi:hypothetical protein
MISFLEQHLSLLRYQHLDLEMICLLLLLNDAIHHLQALRLCHFSGASQPLMVQLIQLLLCVLEFAF